MNKAVIKVIKRNMKGAEEKPRLVADALKSENSDLLEVDKTVNNWILERRRNSRTEKVFSDGRILAWKIIP